MKGSRAKTSRLLFRSAAAEYGGSGFSAVGFQRAADNERAPLRPGTTTTVTLPTYPVPPAPHVPTTAASCPFTSRIPPPMSTGGRSRMPPTQPGTSWDLTRRSSSSSSWSSTLPAMPTPSNRLSHRSRQNKLEYLILLKIWKLRE